MKTNFKLGKHFGVYGVAIKEDKLLVIKKNSGPYQNRYDLPGGSQEIGESMRETLDREVLEETGFSVLDAENSRLYSAWVYENEAVLVKHHVFNLYNISVSSERQDLPKMVADGKNDSDEAMWKKLSVLTEANSSPLILKVIAEINAYPDVGKSEVYENWKILSTFPSDVEK
ncbi:MULTISPECIES: NUDIX hydrolase [unclassified Lactococcus]|uniref:NUDIX hydrolase n=1 Tax=unclassified Lactococcus TaxID=2643510 RepID=UPI0011C800BF|nr:MULTISPECIES: NUDIX hydrolase [unclassified Lactococcus]MQW23767.1 NUDIX domain-containing protein [Lactococcus sp. dk101]TXK37438.1 NUDIX hydrolase [Lactococcus sp. dk310]TXK48781.1 NUDIX hydrolase [Lactococcus sp. dk322]